MVVFGIWCFTLWLVPYSRSLVLAVAEVDISRTARRAGELWGDSIRYIEFDRIMALARITLNASHDSIEVWAVSAYFRFVSAARPLAKHISEAVTERLELELDLCAHFAAVTLDKRLTLAETR
jgi:hypothetical protein